MKSQVNVRLSESSSEKLEFLTTRYGTQTTALEVAIDGLFEKEKAMAGKVYRTPRAVLNAAQKKLGGRINTYDGSLVLTITGKGLSGQVVDDHLSAEQAARKAHLNYDPTGA